MALYINRTKKPSTRVELPRVKKEGRHSELCDIAAKWLTRPPSAKGAAMQIGLAELGSSQFKEIPDAFGFDQQGTSTVVEVKVSRADFLADKAKEFRANPDLGMGDYRYYMCPKGIINESDLEGTKWGLIWVSPKGICKVVRGRATKSTWHQEWQDQWKFTKCVENENILIRTLFLRTSYNLDLSAFLDGLKVQAKVDAAIMKGDPVASTMRRLERYDMLKYLQDLKANSAINCHECAERHLLKQRKLR